MLETARALGELARGGWKPNRTIVMCEWDAEEPGLIGSTEFVVAHGAELQAKAVAYINTDVGVIGPNFNASAIPSLKELVREATREVQAPASERSVYELWREHAAKAKEEHAGNSRPEPKSEASGEPALGALGAGSDFCPFLDHAGIPAMDMGFNGDYGVYHALYDDFYWMKHFGDPTFAYHATMARIVGTVALRLDEADVLPYDFVAYGAEISHATTDMAARATRDGADSSSISAVLFASQQLSASAARATDALREFSAASFNAAQAKTINRALAAMEQSLLVPEGLVGRPWYKHTIYAPGSYAGYAAEILPGPNEALDRKDMAAFQRECSALAAALRRAAAALDNVTTLTGVQE